MVDTNFKTTIDVSSIIWDETDFDSNSCKYYEMIFDVSNLLEKMRCEKPNILIREELLEQMVEGFPFNKLPDRFYEFGNIVYSFLSNIGSNFIQYSDTVTVDISSIPDQKKAYFNDSVKEEISYLISTMHLYKESESIYFTFRPIWNGDQKLKTITNSKTNTYKTLVVDNGNDLEDFFAQFKLTFKHKSKHNCSKHKNIDAWNKSVDKGNFESQLSCYCNKDNRAVQKILDSRHSKCFGNNSYFSYDNIFNVYVVFRITLNNVYHAYDMYDITRVPPEVKNKFNIWEY